MEVYILTFVLIRDNSLFITGGKVFAWVSTMHIFFNQNLEEEVPNFCAIVEVLFKIQIVFDK